MDSGRSKKRKSMANGPDQTASQTRVRVEENGSTKDEPVDDALLAIPLDAHGSLEYGSNCARPTLSPINPQNTAIRKSLHSIE
ncbi:DNA-directed DNA polymerase delta [Puccinia graminis f. sp. tritici]|nr:DNA-directed DNA polymerase delta [Puccinia graminis f. sp. tritici]KAA1109895.1 DNA-directed DNA polymerase delta [Puccinia graminis f. sp. tritici]